MIKRRSLLESMNPKENRKEAKEETTRETRLTESKNKQTIKKEGSWGRLAQWKNVCFVSDCGLNLAVRQVFFIRDLFAKRHDPEASKHVGKNLATSQSETKLAASE